MRTLSSAFPRKHLSRPHRAAGLTRIEVLAILTAVTLLGCLALPVLANHGERSARLVCFGNLRHMGQAIQQWRIEHENRVPWRVPWWEGGTTIPVQPQLVPPAGTVPPVWFTGGLQHNNWFQWYWLSNQLVSPRVLACPSDPGKRQAVDWSRSDTGGFLSGSYRNNASSYFVGLDTFADDAYALVSGDRNMNFILSAGGDGCSSGLRYNGGFNFYSAASSGAALLPGAHGEAGNFLFLDGHVEELSSRSAAIRFMTLIERFGGDSGSSYSHYLIPN